LRLTKHYVGAENEAFGGIFRDTLVPGALMSDSQRAIYARIVCQAFQVKIRALGVQPLACIASEAHWETLEDVRVELL
jgi:hypothetical protein